MSAEATSGLDDASLWGFVLWEDLKTKVLEIAGQWILSFYRVHFFIFPFGLHFVGLFGRSIPIMSPSRGLLPIHRQQHNYFSPI